MKTNYYLIGFENNDTWKPPCLYLGGGVDSVLITADDFDSAKIFASIVSARKKLKYLSVKYNDYKWYIIHEQNED